jgi:hypothetical protein
MEAIAPERIIRERYRVLHLLGEGSSARRLACLDLVADRRVAVKELRVGQLESWKQVEMSSARPRLWPVCGIRASRRSTSSSSTKSSAGG